MKTFGLYGMGGSGGCKHFISIRADSEDAAARKLCGETKSVETEKRSTERRPVVGIPAARSCIEFFPDERTAECLASASRTFDHDPFGGVTSRDPHGSVSVERVRQNLASCAWFLLCEVDCVE